MRRWLSLVALTMAVLMLVHRPVPPAGGADAPRMPSETAWIQRTAPYFQADPDAYNEALAAKKQLVIASKTIDDIGIWQPAGPTNIGGRIVDIEFNPRRPETVYLGAATGGVFRSDDTGRTWTPVFDDQAVLNVGDIALDPKHPDTLYVGTGEANGGHNNFAGGGIYKSTNGGRTWDLLGLESTTSIARVAVHPEQTETVFVAAMGSYFAPNPERGLYRSDDGGQTWTKPFFVSDSTGVIDVLIHPTQPDTMWLATWERVRRVTGARLYGVTSAVWRSYDGGATWEKLDEANGLPDPDARYRPDPGNGLGRIGLALSASNPDVLYASFSDGSNFLGLYRTDDGGDTWFNADEGNNVLSATSDFGWYFGQVRIDPKDPNGVFVLDLLLARSTTGGRFWSLAVGTHVDHHALAFHPENSDYVLNGNDGGLALSEDGGRSWQPVRGLPITQFYEINVDPSDPRRLFGGTQDNGTLYTPDGRTDNWERIYGGDGFYVNIHPEQPNIIYASSQFGGLGRSDTPEPFLGGFTSATRGIAPQAIQKRNWSTPIVIDLSDPDVLYYGTDRVYRTADGGRNWQAISPKMPNVPTSALLGTVTTIAVAPSNSDVIYAGTDDGNVWVTADYGATWTFIGDGLPDRWVTRIVVHPTEPETAYVTFSGLKWRDPQPHVFRTTTLGALGWTDITNNLPDAPVNAFAIDPDFPDQVLYTGTDIGAFFSIDGGDSWDVLGEGLPNVVVNDMKFVAETRTLVVGTHGRSMHTLDLTNLERILGQSVGVEQPQEMFALAPSYPNPFSDRTTFEVTLREAAALRLDVFDLQGRLVRTLLRGPFEAGRQTAQWDGRDTNGAQVASGTYLSRLTVDGSSGRVTQATTLTFIR
ncbi:MAG: FlgD immunoglobulin-like domain containing protein [Bacteroidota bacterium]